MASPSASSGTRLASGSGGDAVAGIASKSKAPTAIDDRPPTPPMSDTEPFPALDAEITTADDTSAAPRVPRIDTDHSRGNTSTSAGVHDAPDTASAECGSAAGQQSDLDHLNVDIEPARSQPSPVTPPYWSHSPAPSEQRPVLSSHQPSALGSPSYASSDTTVSPTTPRSSFDRYSHTRSMTSESIDSLMEGGSSGGGITLRDNENSNLDDRGSACWARSVVIRDYVIVNGGATSIGAFVVWNVRVETLSVSIAPSCEGGEHQGSGSRWLTRPLWRHVGKPHEYLQAILRVRRLT